MIVDMHYHQIIEIPDNISEDFLTDTIRTAKIMNQEIDIKALIQKAKDTWADPDGENLLKGMDEAGIDFTVICSVDNVENDLHTPEIARMKNKKVGDIAQKYPERIMAFAGVDPRRDTASDMLRECFEDFGMRGLKYHPDHGYDPSGPESYKLLEILENMGGILLTHTGPLAPPSRCKYAEPMRLADIGVDFPTLTVIAAHMGYVNWRSWAALATHQPNLYGDLAMWDAYAFGRYELFCRELRDLIDFAGIGKILFGTDDPIFRIVRPTRDWIQLIQDLPVNAPDGIKFTHEEIDAILGGNAAKLLGIG
ncbi:MAG: amidohydrolase family protein [Desulfobacterales bacterium]|nr:amidohydrolase family protein [Desulfobacterales bacterium]